MIDKKELQKLITRYDEKAERAFRNYQETGMGRYDTERRNAEDMADALRAAYHAAEEHQTLISIKGQVVWWAGDAEGLLRREKLPAAVESFLRDVVAYAAAVCHYAPRDQGRTDEQAGEEEL